MTDTSQNSSAGQRNWFERLTQSLLGEPKDREQLLEVMRDAHSRNLLDLEALTMIEGVLQVAEMQVRDIMIPRAQMVMIDRDAPTDEILSTIVRSGHSRFPVVGDDRDQVIGILLAKDMLWYYMEGEGRSFNFRDLLRPSAFVPESKRLNVLLREFRASRNHLAIVVDEYGGVAGMVTIEDVLEQIVGEIEDEHDVEESSYVIEHAPDQYTVKALMPIEDFNEHFHCAFSDGEFDTIGGLIMSRFGHMPKRGESVRIERFVFKVLRADSRRVHLFQVALEPSTDEAEAAERS